MREDVEFASEGLMCRGWLYYDPAAGPRPTVVLAGGWCYVRGSRLCWGHPSQ